MPLSETQIIKLKECLLEQLDDVAIDDIQETTRLRDDLDFDSLLAANLTLDVESAFDIEVEEEEISGLETVADLYVLVEQKLSV